MYEPLGDYCPVCGLEQEDDVAKLTGYICVCCGEEYSGYFPKEYILDLRQKWIEAGYAWDVPRERPPDWDPQEQMKNIPVAFR